MMNGGEIMEKLHFSKSEVTAFVEELILDQMATEDEQVWYENFIWNGEMKKDYTYKKLIRKMKKVYDGI